MSAGAGTVAPQAGLPVTLNLERMWSSNFKLSAGLVHGFTIADLMDDVAMGSIESDQLISHKMGMSQMQDAYHVFSNASKTGSLKVLISNDFEARRGAGDFAAPAISARL